MHLRGPYTPDPAGWVLPKYMEIVIERTDHAVFDRIAK